MAKRNPEKESARARAAAIKAEQEAKERKQRLLIVLGTLAVLLLVVGGIVFAALNRGDDSGSSQATSGTKLSPAAQQALTNVPAAQLDAAGVAAVQNFPSRIKDGTAITSNGKPQILYVGAEYCPFCAGLRWSTAIAMSRFGTWNDLTTTASAQEPSLPPLETISFSKKSGAKLTSDIVDFVSYETSTNELRNGRYTKLDTLDGADEQTFRRLDAPPYVPEQNKGAIPFISFGGKVVQAGGGYDITLLKGKTAEQIATALKNPKDPLTAAILADANALTAATCEVTGNKPADVCSAPGVKAAAAKLG